MIGFTKEQIYEKFKRTYSSQLSDLRSCLGAVEIAIKHNDVNTAREISRFLKSYLGEFLPAAFAEILEENNKLIEAQINSLNRNS